MALKSVLKPRILIPIIGFIIVTILFKNWFYSSGEITYADWYYLFPDSLRELSEISIYNPNNLGYGESTPWIKPLLILSAYLGNIGFSFSQITRLVFILPGIIAAYWGTYFWVYHRSKNIYSALICAFFLLFNTYSLILSTNHLTLYSAINFIPLSLLFFDLFNEYKNEIKGRLALLSMFITSIFISCYEFRIFLIYVVIMSSYAIIEIGFNPRKYFASKWTWVMLSILVMNIFWILPTILAESKSYQGFLGRDIFGNQFLTLSHSLTVTHPFWTLSGITVFQTNTVLLVYWLIPIAIIFITSYAERFITHKSVYREFYYFSFLIIVGMFLSKQAAFPYQTAYKWLFEHIPFFQIYREATKFFTITIIGIIGLIRIYSQKIENKYTYFVLTLLLLPVFINIAPILTNQIGGLYENTEEPKIYREINDYIQHDRDNFGVVWLPNLSRWSYFTNNKPRISHTEIANLYKELEPSIDRRNYKILEDQKYNDILTSGNAKYLVAIFDKEFDSSNNIDEIRNIILKKPEYYTIIIDKPKYLLLKNTKWVPYSNNNVSKVSFNTYKIKSDINEKIVLPTQSDTNWQLTKNLSVFETAFKMNNLPAKQVGNENGMQEFDLESYVTYPENMYAQYFPDSLFKLGIIISGIIFSITIILIMYPTKNTIK